MKGRTVKICQASKARKALLLLDLEQLYKVLLWLYWGYTGIMEKEHGNYYNGLEWVLEGLRFRVLGLGLGRRALTCSSAVYN